MTAAGNGTPTLPRTSIAGLEVSRLALGGFHQVEISSEVVHAVVDAFAAAGGNYIETARGYGKGASEEKIGRAIAGRREQFVLASKSGAATADDLRRNLEATLTALGTDHLEFYFFHGINRCEKLDAICAPGGALAGMQTALDEKLIQGMGMSSHVPQMYMEGLERLPLSLILIWSNFLEDQYLPEISRQIIPAAHDHGVAVTAMKPLADGFLYRSATDALRFSLGSGADVVVCGMNAVSHVTQAVRAVCQGAANEEERARILWEAPELGAYVCRHCGACPGDLMELFRLEGFVDRQMIDYLEHDPADYALRLRLSGWFGLAEAGRERFAAAGWDEAALLKAASGIACPYHIDVPRKTRLALAKLGGNDPQRL